MIVAIVNCIFSSLGTAPSTTAFSPSFSPLLSSDFWSNSSIVSCGSGNRNGTKTSYNTENYPLIEMRKKKWNETSILLGP
jgi:hypothetical protein